MAPGAQASQEGEPQRIAAWRLALGEVCRQRRINLVAFDALPSTNSLGRRVAMEYLGEGRQPPRTVVAAWEQTAGRGRQGRRWVSPAGEGIYASWLEPFDDRARKHALPLITAVAVAVCLGELLQVPCLIRWPNDLLVRDRKIGGILIESLDRGSSAGAAIIGFGVNHGHAASAVPDRKIIAVEDVAAGAVTLGQLGGALLEALGRGLDEDLSQSELVARYRSCSAHHEGDRISVRTGETDVEGAFRGFDELGRLRLETENGRERVFGSGEIDA